MSPEPRKKHKAEEIVAELRQVDVLTAQGRPVAEAVRSIGGRKSPIIARGKNMVAYKQRRQSVPLNRL